MTHEVNHWVKMSQFNLRATFGSVDLDRVNQSVQHLYVNDAFYCL